jgi:hypothetical protein
MANKQKLEQRLGEALGLEMAAQKAVEELSSKGLLEQGEIPVDFLGYNLIFSNFKVIIHLIYNT